MTRVEQTHSKPCYYNRCSEVRTKPVSPTQQVHIGVSHMQYAMTCTSRTPHALLFGSVFNQYTYVLPILGVLTVMSRQYYCIATSSQVCHRDTLGEPLCLGDARGAGPTTRWSVPGTPGCRSTALVPVVRAHIGNRATLQTNTREHPKERYEIGVSTTAGRYIATKNKDIGHP